VTRGHGVVPRLRRAFSRDQWGRGVASPRPPPKEGKA